MHKSLFLASAALLAAPAVLAQAVWPSAKPISIIVPFGAGGSVDATARLLADKLGERLKQSVVVDNVTGAGGVIGLAKAAQAAPDGYTLVMGADSPVAIAPYANPKAVRYDVARDLAPIGLVNTAPMVLVARKDLPASNLAELVQLAKKEPGKLSYATSGVGTVLHLAMELIKQQGQFFATHVPYRGGAQIATDVIGGQVDLAMLVSVSAAPFVQGGKLKAIAVTSAKPFSATPGVPTVASQIPDFVTGSWQGLLAPAGTPPAILDKLAAEIQRIVQRPEVRAKLIELGSEPTTMSRQQISDWMKTETSRWGALVKKYDIKPS